MNDQRIGFMDNYEVWLGPVTPALSEFSFEPYLYGRTEHIATQPPGVRFSVWLWNTDTCRVDALLWADREEATICSQVSAPFGGLQSAEGTSSKALAYLLSCLETWCKPQGIRHILIKTPPACYDEIQHFTLQKVYESNGFRVEESTPNHHIPVLSEPFINTIRSAERRRLRKCLRAGFDHAVWGTPDPATVYAFLREFRRRKGYALPMDFTGFSALLTQLPDDTLVFRVKDGEKLICLTVAIRVNGRMLYNFCPADDPDYRSFSPSVMLNAALYEYAQREGVERIDLGVSLDHLGNEKASLIRFKKNIGGQVSVKLTYGKVLA